MCKEIDYSKLKLRDPMTFIPDWWYNEAGETAANMMFLYFVLSDYIELGLTTEPLFKRHNALYMLIDGPIPESTKEDMLCFNLCLIKQVSIKDAKYIIDWDLPDYIKWINYESLVKIFKNEEDMDYVVTQLYRDDEDNIFCDLIEHEYHDRLAEIREACTLIQL